MPLEVKKQDRETTQALIRRFGRAVKESGILVRVRRGRFKQRPLSGKKQRDKALRGLRIKAEFEKMRKMGKKPER